MRVFITGATGFAGSHLVDQLLAAGHAVFALVHRDTSHQALPEDARVTAVPGDLLDGETLKTAVAAAAPDVIYHLAGQAYPALSWQKPAFTLAINTGGTANVLDAAVAYGRPRVVVVTSAEIYGQINAEMLPLTEATPPSRAILTASASWPRASWRRFIGSDTNCRWWRHGRLTTSARARRWALWYPTLPASWRPSSWVGSRR
jgi:nucleoside-diphosphate-sugar epimerase